MIRRRLQPHLERLATEFPIITVTGPRQSGKTTLTRMAFPERPYVSLETPAEREFALTDPVGFLARYPDGAILDEIQRAPELLSYLQGMVDEDARPGRFVLTGSQNLALLDAVSQSLAGRTAITELLPLDVAELRRFEGAPDSLGGVIFTGGYPRILDRRHDPAEWLAAYVATYLERDVRSLVNVGDLSAFQTFLRLCAGRVGQLLNLSDLAADAGVSQPTARRWLSALEAGFIAFRLQAFHANLSKRLVKAPKLYFYDSGLAAHLIGLRNASELETHPLRGALFESWVVAEILKQHWHAARRPRLSFYAERGRLEVDLIVEDGRDLTAIEVKAGRTPASGWFSALDTLGRRLGERGDGRCRLARKAVVYGGEENQKRSAGDLVSWRNAEGLGFGT